ncbi:MAG: acyl-CoA dehydrogenase family protein [Paracoccus sp. (in: a-proteobacteria)]|nr:acyl-CoA dehydrogenase family protein [Paracoccus sp. (in: a-proteobacteria)]
MDFRLSDDHRMLQDSLRGILSRHSGEGIWPALADLGVPDAVLTDAEGGYDGTGQAVVLVLQELGRAAIAPRPVADMIGAALMARAGQPVRAGARMGFADAEPGTRFDRGVSIRAEDDRLSGIKTMAAWGNDLDALMVTTHDAVWHVALDAPGLNARPCRLLDGRMGADLLFEGVPATRLCNLSDAVPVFARATLAHAAHALGLIETAFELTLDYLRTRQQFGQPLFAFQALAHRCADMAVEIEQARSAVINLAGHMEAADGPRDRFLQACKVTVGHAARLVAEESLQLHGGIGMTEEYALGGLVRQLLAADTAFGDADWHLERFARAEPAFT